MKSKITLVYLDHTESIAEETVWVEVIKDGLYRIDNIPFFAPNLAYNDIVTVENDNGVLYFDDLIESSGHSTIQIVFFNDNQLKEVLDELELVGCKWEGMKNQLYYAIDVPPNTNYMTVKDILNTQHYKGNLDYKEACLATK